MGLRYDPTSGKLLCDPTSGRLVGACPWIVSLPKSPYTMRNWGIDDEEPYSSYATALADIQIG
ncbi:MAG: hypothetical protein JXL80_17590, partial [Planctomycetes bacterium]|nr:hypothetical protein [Planctomycetota bacterium]